MARMWIQKQGRTAEDGISALIAELPEAVGEEYLYIAYYTYTISSGKIGYKDKAFIPAILDIKRLLELRIFSNTNELKMARTQMGKEFIWRLANEKDIRKSVDNDILTESHYLDIDTTIAPRPCADGVNVEFASTTGAAFTLPVKAGRWPKKVRLLNYITYDKAGNLQIVDYRLRGFTLGGVY